MGYSGWKQSCSGESELIHTDLILFHRAQFTLSNRLNTACLLPDYVLKAIALRAENHSHNTRAIWHHMTHRAIHDWALCLWPPDHFRQLSRWQMPLAKVINLIECFFPCRVLLITSSHIARDNSCALRILLGYIEFLGRCNTHTHKLSMSFANIPQQQHFTQKLKHMALSSDAAHSYPIHMQMIVIRIRPFLINFNSRQFIKRIPHIFHHD